MNNLERRVLDAIDMDALLALLCDLVAIPSLDGSPEEIARNKVSHTAKVLREALKSKKPSEARAEASLAP